MTETTAPQMITTIVSVTRPDADRWGPDAWLVQSVVDGEVDPYWTIENVPFGLAASSSASRHVAARLHLARTHRDRRVDRLGRAMQEEAEIQAEVDDLDLRAYRAELRLVAMG